jgi:predicted ATP-dependent endonuclease of OLD family
MLSRSNTADTIIFRKDKDEGIITNKPLRYAVETALAHAPSQSRVLFELGNLADIYFSDCVVLCEGITDRRLIPLAYEKLYSRPMELDHMTVVALGSCSDIPKALPVLESMGIKACAITDLDFAFIGVRKGNPPLLPKNDDHIKKAKEVFKRLQSTHGFPLAENGLPQKDITTGWKAADTWGLMAKDPEGVILAQAVHDQLKKHNIWIWEQGCIEHVTGATDKGEDAIAEQEGTLQTMSSEEVIEQFPAFKSCFDWIMTV